MGSLNRNHHSYEKLPPNNFKIFLNKRKTEEIKFDSLIDFSQDIITKINIIKFVTSSFSDPKNNLPLKGY